MRRIPKKTKGVGFLLLLVFSVRNVPGLAQDRASRPIDPGAAFAMGNSPTAENVDYCDPGKKRALVLSGGGLKGAFQAGATYHFIVHRSCDFSEIAGVSVGSLNAVILAQAQRDENPEVSLKNMVGQAEKGVDLWQNIRSSKQILKPRWPGWMWALAIRYGLFGTESMNTFDPLMHLIQTNVDMDALDRGRPVRVGSVSLWDGTYREVGPSATFPNNDRKYFLQYVYASALIPILGKMPRIQQSEQDTDAKQWIQYGDGGILNNTPFCIYFRKCEPQESPGQAESESPPCLAWLRAGTPPPQDVQQLFVVVTSPFTRNVDRYPVGPKLLARGSKQVTDGRKILLRTIDLILETDFREDLMLMLESNAVLAWRKRTYDAMTTVLTPEQRNAFDQRFAEINKAFPLHSYNEAPDGGPSLPYDVVVVAPEKVYAETFDVDR